MLGARLKYEDAVMLLLCFLLEGAWLYHKTLLLFFIIKVSLIASSD